MELTTFNPYSGKFAGYNIAKGKLTTELHYSVDEGRLNAQHHVIVDQLEFGAATGSKEAVPLPIKLAVSLLKDRHGVIDLDVPVNGTLDDPKFRLGPIIWKAVVNLFAKAVTSPFALLGKLTGGGDELAFVDFTPGSMDLTAEQTGKLGKLAGALVERPQLKLDIPLTVAVAADDAALTQRAFDSALAALPASRSLEPKVKLKALTALYAQKLGHQPAFPAPAENTDKTAQQAAFLEQELRTHFATAIQADKQSLARGRAEAVKNALLTNTGVAPDRVFLTSRPSEAASPEGAVRMELKVE